MYTTLVWRKSDTYCYCLSLPPYAWKHNRTWNYSNQIKHRCYPLVSPYNLNYVLLLTTGWRWYEYRTVRIHTWPVFDNYFRILHQELDWDIHNFLAQKEGFYIAWARLYDMDIRKLKWEAMCSEVKEAISDQKNVVTQTACTSQYQWNTGIQFIQVCACAGSLLSANRERPRHHIFQSLCLVPVPVT